MDILVADYTKVAQLEVAKSRVAVITFALSLSGLLRQSCAFIHFKWFLRFNRDVFALLVAPGLDL